MSAGSVVLSSVLFLILVICDFSFFFLCQAHQRFVSFYWSFQKRFFFLFFSQLCNAACRILVPRSGIETRPWQWKPRILTTRPAGPSPLWFSLLFFCFQFHLLLLFIYSPLLPFYGFLKCGSLDYWFESILFSNLSFKKHVLEVWGLLPVFSTCSVGIVMGEGGSRGRGYIHI